jgi:Na+-driven multidrug efflux pump
MQASALSILFMPMLSAVAGMSQGMKQPVYMVGQMFVYLVCLRLPLADWFAGHWGQEGVYWSHPVASASTAVLSLFLLRRLLQDCCRRVTAVKPGNR